MTAKAAQYANEIVSLTILALMVLALIAGQAAQSRADAAAAADNAGRYEVERRPLVRVVDASLDPIAEVLTMTSGRLEGQHSLKATRTRRPATR